MDSRGTGIQFIIKVLATLSENPFDKGRLSVSMMAQLGRSLVETAKVISRNLRNVKFEPEVAYLRFILGNNDICLHIGASDGRHSYVMSQLASDGWVYCFEPSSFSFGVLRRVMNFHRLTNVTCVNAAVSDEPGFTLLVTPVKTSGRIARSWGFISETQPISDQPRSEIQTRGVIVEKVKSLTIDDFCVEKKIDKIDFIRCDVEGSEMKVLNGAKRTIEKNLPNALVEIHPICLRENFESSGDSVKEFFLSRGYRMLCLNGSTLTEIKSVTNERWRDYFFIHPVRAAKLPLGPFLRVFQS